MTVTGKIQKFRIEDLTGPDEDLRAWLDARGVRVVSPGELVAELESE